MTRNKWLASLVLTMLCVTALAAPAQAARPPRALPAGTGVASANPNDPKDEQAFWDELISSQLQKDHIAGAVVTVVSQGQTVFSKGYGYSDLEAQTPVDPARTLFRPGSISKLFVGVAAMQLVEQGRLDMSVDVNRYLKDFQIPATYSQPVTMANLLTHTAGFDTTYRGTYVRSPADLEPLGPYLATHLPDRVVPPGQVTAYSNYGISLAGHVIEQITGMPFDQYVSANILQPLGMEHSTFTQPPADSLSGAMSKGYLYSNGQFLPRPFEVVQVWPAGSLSATAADMDRFMIAMLGDGSYGGSRVLQPASVRELEKLHFQAAPQVSGMAYTFEEMHINGLRLLNKAGDTTVFHSDLMLIPEKNVGFYVSYNTLTAVLIKEDAIQLFLDRYFPAATAQAVIPVTGGAQDTAQYLGDYSPTQRAENNYWKFVQLPNSWPIRQAPAGGIMAPDALGHFHRFVEVDSGVFHQADGQEVIVFRLSGSGEMTMIIGNQPIIEYTRLPWYEGQSFQGALLLACLLIFLSALVAWPVAALIRWRRRQALPPQAQAVRWVAALAAVFAILFVAGYLSLISQAFLTGFGIQPGAIAVVLTFGMISAVLGVTAAIFTIWVWSRGFPMRLAGQLHYTVVAAACLAFVWFLYTWNLLGYHF